MCLAQQTVGTFPRLTSGPCQVSSEAAFLCCALHSRDRWGFPSASSQCLAVLSLPHRGGPGRFPAGECFTACHRVLGTQIQACKLYIPKSVHLLPGSLLLGLLSLGELGDFIILALSRDPAVTARTGGGDTRAKTTSAFYVL